MMQKIELYIHILFIFVLIILVAFLYRMAEAPLKAKNPAVKGGLDQKEFDEYFVDQDNMKSMYFKLKNGKAPIRNVKSDKLIDLIVNYGSYEDYYRLCSLIAKFIRYHRKDYAIYIANLLDKRNGLSDAAIMSKISSLIPKEDNDDGDTWRDENHAEKLRYIIKQHTKLGDKSEYLDYGCGDCKIAKILAKKLGPGWTAHGADVKEWITKFNRPSDVKFEYIVDGKIAFPDKKFNLVSANMVLHHVPELDVALKELVRVMKPGGYLILREHDALSPIDYALIDLEHMLYSICIHKMTLDEFRKNYYGKYYDKMEWDIMLKKYGFKRLWSEYDYNGFGFKVTPTRYYYSVYLLDTPSTKPLEAKQLEDHA
jgi:ubiquinone/menaquinone biosynthesis C-methylase UbiE